MGKAWSVPILYNDNSSTVDNLKSYSSSSLTVNNFTLSEKNLKIRAAMKATNTKKRKKEKKKKVWYFLMIDRKMGGLLCCYGWVVKKVIENGGQAVVFLEVCSGVLRFSLCLLCLVTKKGREKRIRFWFFFFSFH